MYTARITLEGTGLQAGGPPTSLSPGMAITAEIKSGRRRIIEHLLSPIARQTSEAFEDH